LKKEYEIHIATTNKAFPIKQTQLELTWKATPAYANLTETSKIQSQKFLDKLYTYGITTLLQIQNTTTKAILTLEEFRTIYNHAPKTIKAALHQAQTLFPHSQTHTPQRTIQPPPPTNITNTQQLDPPLGQAIHKIIKEKTTTRKDKWGAQAINKSYLCLWQNTNNTIQQWRNEEDLLHPDNILFDHNLLTITQYNNTLFEQSMAKTYANYLSHVQTRDKKFIQPPLKITNLTTSTQECNPDKDILVNKPTIQTSTSGASVYDQNGNHIATINIDRLQWLWSQFTHNKQQHLINFLHPPPQDFETEVLWLLQRYVTILPKKKPKIIQHSRLGAKGPPLVGEEVRKRVGT
jgi:hypothetical protein